MRRIGRYGRNFVLLALSICIVGVLFKIIDEILAPKVVVDTDFSNSHFEEECRLKMSFINWHLMPVKKDEYPSDISWLRLEKPLPLVYRVSEDKKSFLLTCQARQEGRRTALYPVITEKGHGLVKGPPELKTPFPGYKNLTLREFLNIPHFNGKYVVHKMGRFNVLALKADVEDEEVFVMVLNPDSDLKRLYHGLPIGSLLSEEDRVAIISKYQVEDPFVLERLKPTWNPYEAPSP